MGEYADYMINGDDCQECGIYMGQGDGYPRTCSDCRRSARIEASLPKADSAGKAVCPVCQRRVKQIGLRDHMRDSHASVSAKECE